MTPDELEAMLAADTAEWHALTEALDARPDQPLHGADEPAWIARDVYNHLRRWMDYSMDDLAGHLDGTSVARPPGSEDEINARFRAEGAHLTHAEAREQAQAAFDRRSRVLRGLSPDQWTPEIDSIAHADDVGHISEHRLAIV